MSRGPAGPFQASLASALNRGSKIWQSLLSLSCGSTFRKDTDGSITLVASDVFGPGDNYSNIWHVFDLLRDGSNGWEPQYKY